MRIITILLGVAFALLFAYMAVIAQQGGAIATLSMLTIGSLTIAYLAWRKDPLSIDTLIYKAQTLWFITRNPIESYWLMRLEEASIMSDLAIGTLIEQPNDKAADEAFIYWDHQVACLQDKVEWNPYVPDEATAIYRHWGWMMKVVDLVYRPVVG